MPLFLIPIIAALITQGTKILIHLFAPGAQKRSLRHLLIGYGGMPSSHAAFVFSLLTVVWEKDGFFSSLFAVVVVFTLIVIRDALGLRRAFDEQRNTMNILIEKHCTSSDQHTPKYFTEPIGHTPLEVTAGSILGIMIAFIFLPFSG